MTHTPSALLDGYAVTQRAHAERHGLFLASPKASEAADTTGYLPRCRVGGLPSHRQHGAPHYAEHGFLLAPPLARDLDVEFYIESSAYHRTDTRWVLRSP